ncbi:Acriflavine sensitivity control protein acr-2 [Fusarium oxysporum f. sp. cubense race 1]|uniref:Acriflavine sensitivity control protein acr-2 n=1 Tax=Fusarium oxysporum f. sp. cubense (strain race 1) TaxID=1229664 RepID=N4TL68_FUSC1|nr:Acriflavine sensitivity control protein acr-2 [Fusarium oxysporum f. sp. cubense race 1]
MASRGKMMGKATFDTITDNAHDHKDISDIELCTNFPVAGSPLVDPSLQNIPRSYHDYIRYFIAAVLLFVNLDVVEFGGRGWKYHLRGAEELIRIRKGLVIDDSEKSEQQTWIGCPADLLSVLHVMNTLRTVSDHSSHADETATSILDGLDNFSPRSWAHDFPDPQHHESRHHLAHAYKAAVSIYVYHAIRETLGQPPLPELDISRISNLGILHMSQIPASDFHIKSLVWPAFVLGAEAQDLRTREEVKNIMHNIWVSSCCYNVKTATGMLGRIWERGQDDNKDKYSWLRFIWEQDESWLFL